MRFNFPGSFSTIVVRPVASNRRWLTLIPPPGKWGAAKSALGLPHYAGTGAWHMIHMAALMCPQKPHCLGVS
eukprot:CAMPEP_0183334850 /NCGR_PEP_ID=MMETSP0164_2-20130417/3329_1 /TAXON_ID=221442 /ORGANISM="Coccolithus pelagicus ssp braarudi, Strain PLY182g" /LENGTH=71 /DNA_ID=CAMNT_0025504077 /DNA_START=9 /DNA_END=225 /DNA_ORIENTATION=+